jgi:8-oxo-dGTP pyrophosphatase MutT (NUDIX family)
MENGETASQAAIRETHEEAGARILVDAPFAMVSIAHINQVHLFYRGRMADPHYAAGEESLEVSLCEPGQIPWHDLAFSSVRLCLERYLADRTSGTFGFHETELSPQ